MREPEIKRDENAIRELIEVQEKEALARFRAGHFRERLEKRIQQTGAQTSRPSLLQAFPSPVWVSLALLALLGGALLTQRFLLRAPVPVARLSIEHFLRQLPGMQAIEKQPRELSGPKALPPSFLEKLIADALTSPAHSAKVTPKPSPYRHVSPNSKPAGPQSLRQIYDILLIDKAVERVLTELYEKTKEGQHV
jgi:hypothetical protein